MAERSPVVSLANQIPFAVACQAAGVDVPPASLRGTRAFCPFGEFSHSDGGREPAMRVYPDHGYCFAEALYLTPVRIYAMVRDLDEEEAARQLLDYAGLAQLTYAERWERLNRELLSECVDTDALAQALRVWLAGAYPGWAERQYEPQVAGRLAWCLGLLSRVRTNGDCRYWLEQSKKVMALTVEGGGR